MEENKKSKKEIKDILSYIGKLFFSALIAILLFIGAFLLFITIEGKISLSKGKSQRISIFTIISGSMEPSIGVFDIILDTRVDDFSKIKVGDVITFNRLMAGDIEAKTITHRVVDIRDMNGKYEFITKGDANATADKKPVQETDIIGRTVVKIPKLGIITYILLTKLGWILIIFLPALGIVVYDIIKLFKIVGVNENAKKIKKSPEYNLKIKEENKKIDATIEKIKKKYNK